VNSVQVYENDGSLLAASVNAVCLALLDAAIPLRHLVVASSCAYTQNDARLLLDPTLQEEQVSWQFLDIRLLSNTTVCLGCSSYFNRSF
jgi:exosome complex component RRP46